MNASIKVEIEIEEEQPNCPTQENDLEFEEETISVIKPEQTVCFIKSEPRDYVELDRDEGHIENMKAVKVLLTKFDNFICVGCDRDLDQNGPIGACKHHNEIVLICNDCIKPTGKKFTCVKYDHGFARRNHLIDHVGGVHRKLKKYHCDECDEAFAYTSVLNIHVQSVHRKLKHACQQCKKVFSNRDYLSRHVNFTHLKLDKYTHM